MAAERRPAILAGLMIAAALCLAACGHDGGADSPPERGDQAVAKVLGELVALSGDW